MQHEATKKLSLVAQYTVSNTMKKRLLSALLLVAVSASVEAEDGISRADYGVDAVSYIQMVGLFLCWL